MSIRHWTLEANVDIIYPTLKTWGQCWHYLSDVEKMRPMLTLFIRRWKDEANVDIIYPTLKTWGQCWHYLSDVEKMRPMLTLFIRRWKDEANVDIIYPTLKTWGQCWHSVTTIDNIIKAAVGNSKLVPKLATWCYYWHREADEKLWPSNIWHQYCPKLLWQHKPSLAAYSNPAKIWGQHL